MEQALQDLVWRRANRRCEYCRVAQENDRLPFEIDHIIALKHRGPTRASNLCLACFACNNHKGPNISGIDSRTNKIVPLFNPRRHKWHRHFRWDDGAILVGRTPTGRATVAVLEINLDYRVEFRRELIHNGLFPPP
jgi:5-methylcytosine-specific restriction endonuclease McrA